MKFCFPALIVTLFALAPVAVLGADGSTQHAREAFFESHCYDCHDSTTQKGTLNLEALKFDLSDRASFETWVKVHDLIRDGEMPPKKKPRPEAAKKVELLAALGADLVAADRARLANALQPTVRRLNRFEYESSLRELLDAPWLLLADLLPEDGTAHLFNKSPGSLDVSHVQMTKYLEVGARALRAAVDAAAHPRKTERFYAREEPTIMHYLRWRPGLQTAATRSTMPLLDLTPQPDVIRGSQPATVGEADPATREREAMGVFSGTYAATTKYDFTRLNLPVDGRYRVRMKSYTFLAGPNGANGGDDHGLTGGQEAWWRPDRNVAKRGTRSEPVTLYALKPSGDTRWLTTFDAHPDPAVIEREVALVAGEAIRPDASRLVRTRPGWKGNPNATPDGVPGWAINWLEVEGPITREWPPESYKAVFGAMPFEVKDGAVRAISAAPEKDARRLLADFARRAFRGRGVPAEGLERYVAIFREAQELGDDFTDAMLAACTAVLCSPEFLYLDASPGKLDQPALASRLSYFLWNGPPDAALLNAVDLHDRDTLTVQTERLLNDPRSQRFVEAFLDYWLDLRDINTTAPDAELYPEYYLDTLLSESALLETRRFFRTLLEENLPARNLIESDFTFVNERLARHYGLDAPGTVDLQRVTLPADSPRGGLLTQASVLKVTANGTTTSPVLRGVWLVERILGIDIPPPPSGVEAIEPDTRGAVTIREQLARHSQVASCAACHEKFDPIGFALESFDVAGGWRDRYRALGAGERVEGIGKNGHAFTFGLARKVECDAQLGEGRRFADVRGLKKLLLEDERRIARNLVHQLVIYATGAPVSFSQRAAVERILVETKASGYGVRDLVHAVVTSEMFTGNAVALAESDPLRKPQHAAQ